MRCHTRWVTVVCCGFVSVVLSDLSMAIVLSGIAHVFIDGRFASARMSLTGVVRSWPVIARPALCCDLSWFSNVELDIHGCHEDVPYSTFECPVAM